MNRLADPKVGYGTPLEPIRQLRILQIGNYPPPFCGWAVQTKLLVEEIRRRGHICVVLNINENRRKKSTEYVGVQNSFDYVQKLVRFALKGYRFQVHVNGQSKPGYVLALVASVIGRLAGMPVLLCWRGGLQQRFFPRLEALAPRWAFQLLFRLAGKISCNSNVVKEAIVLHGIQSSKVATIPGFSSRHLIFTEKPLGERIEGFLSSHHPIFFCYVSFRREYELPMLREAMLLFLRRYPRAGFIWLGFPDKELPLVNTYVNGWPSHERQCLLLLGNLAHDEFLTLLRRSSAYIRTPACDGVSASILESLALGIPVVACENGHRPPGVIRYRESDAADLCAKLVSITTRPTRPIEERELQEPEDNIAKTADWLLADVCKQQYETDKDLVHV